MSDENNGSKKGKLIHGNFPRPEVPPTQPKGPPRPWPQDMEASAENLIEFLKDPDSKQSLKEFIIETFKQFEAEKIQQIKARVENERETDSNTQAPYHRAGNLGPMMAEALTMNETEQAFARGLKSTKNNLVRAAEERVDEINRLLAGIGGFSSQLKACFARSTVVFLEQEDPKRPFRERLIFSINLPHYELKKNWNTKPSKSGKEPSSKGAKETDGRTTLQATWDDAVNALAQIISSTGLKPKYVKNDRHYGRFVIKQDLRHSSSLPDEYFSFTLDYNTSEKIADMVGPYNQILGKYNAKMNKLAKKLDSYPADSRSERYLELKRQYLNVLQERDYFVGTTPDPNQLDEGLVFLIEVSTLKDYHVVKDRMQSIMTKYILHLSQIAMSEAQVDPDLEYEVWKGSQNRKVSHSAGSSNDQSPDDDVIPENVTEYEVDASALKPIPKGNGKKVA